MNKYIALDTETGGIGSQYSLLTAYLAILDEDFNITADIYLNCKPNDGIYRVGGQGMAVNGIDLAKHDKIARPYIDCSNELYNFLYINKIKGHLKPIGQNVKFDINRITDDLVEAEAWHQMVSYRTLDTSVIAGFAIELGLLPLTLNAGLKAMAEYFGVGKQEDFGHDAKQDTLLTIGVYKALMKLFRYNLVSKSIKTEEVKSTLSFDGIK